MGFPALRAARPAWIAAAAALLALTACGEPDVDVETRLHRAQSHFSEGRVMASAIELRNAIYENPNDPRPHLEMAKIYAEAVADSESAEAELLRARELGAPHSRLQIPLARARIGKGQYVDALEALAEIEQAAGIGQDIILALRGDAYRGLKQPTVAADMYRNALQINSKSLPALVGLTRLALEDGSSLEQVEHWLAKALEAAPGDRDTRLLKGEIEFRKASYVRSEETLTGLAREFRFHAPTRLALTRALIARGKFVEAVANLDDAFTSAANDPDRNYLRALAAYQDGDFDGAKRYAEAVLDIRQEDTQALLIAAAASYATGNYQATQNHLERYFRAESDSVLARRLYGSTLLRLGHVLEARKVLSALTAQAGDDAALLSMIGGAALAGGDFENAEKYLLEASRLRPGQKGLQAQIGLSRVALGRPGADLSSLETKFEGEGAEAAAAATRFLGLFNEQDYIGALKAARAIQQEAPDSALGPTLTGIARVRLNDIRGAKEAFTEALRLDHEYAPAIANLGALARSAGNFEEAKVLYSRLLSVDPYNLVAMIRMAEVQSESGEIEDAINLLDSARNKFPEAKEPARRLSQLLFRSGRTREAMITAAKILERHRDEPGVLEVLGRSQLALGQPREALLTFSRLVEVDPGSAEDHQLLAAAHLILRDLAEARLELEKALVLAPNHPRARASMVRLLVAENKPKQARKVIDALKADFPEDITVMRLDAGVAMAEKRPAAAVKILEQAEKRDSDTRLIVQLARAKWATDDHEGSYSTLRKWLARFPADVIVRLELANFLLEQEQHQEAAEHLRIVVETMPLNPVALNNLAWALHRQNNNATALYHAERALELAPENPVIMDTLGVILLAQDNTSKAFRLFRSSLKAAPDRPATRYHFAKALVAMGKTGEARKILRTVVSGKKPFAEKAEAKQLLRKLGG